MKKAIYHAPGTTPKTYDCQHGAAPGTVDLLNAAGRVIVSGLPVRLADEIPAQKACAVLVVEAGEKMKASKKEPQSPNPPTIESLPVDTPLDTAGS